MSFKDLNIIDPLQEALDKEGYIEPTPIQALAIPHLLKGKDLMGIAQTGTGKTAAFVLPILQRLSEERKAPVSRAPSVLVLAPTRELAAQIDQSFATYGRFLQFRHTVIFGGVGQGPQVMALSKGVDILVATPGRLIDLMNQGHLNLRNVKFFVLDEIDRMLDMGFIHDVKKITQALPKKHQSLFFSATVSRETEEFARGFLSDPVHVEAAPEARTNTLDCIEQRVFFVEQNDKYPLLQDLLQDGDLERALIFTRTKHGADKLTVKLIKDKVKAMAIHGNKSQNQRDKAMRDFKSGRLQVLVATDVAARGIDVKDISHVVNYDLPNESEVYIHRIGRTGRAGAQGTAFSFCASDERSLLRSIERLINMKIEVADHQYHSEKAKNAVGPASATAGKYVKKPKAFSRRSSTESVNRPGPRKSYPPRRH
jgi:ATP-dependent RNA helicase RhlE